MANFTIAVATQTIPRAPWPNYIYNYITKCPQNSHQILNNNRKVNTIKNVSYTNFNLHDKIIKK